LFFLKGFALIVAEGKKTKEKKQKIINMAGGCVFVFRLLVFSFLFEHASKDNPLSP